ncbi:MAG TPA: histidine kinase [Longimicrobiales bacterium]|nr:histidine kinase [Longimicrobiales bacterium]
MRIWLVGLAAWTALAVLSMIQVSVSLWSMGRAVDWWMLAPRSLIDWYTCAVFTPAYFWMVRRWPLERRRAARTVAIYLAITGVIVVLRFGLYVPLQNLLIADPSRAMTMRSALTGSFIRENIAFWCLLAVVLSVEYFRNLHEREVQATRLQAQLAEARLDALSAQLHPHFLFNTIQGISTLIHRDADAADLMLARLSTMLRHTLQRDGRHEIPLAQELDLLELYLGIVRARFEDRLTVTIDVAPDTLDVLVPRFLLQPLVENALHHGIARRAGAGRIDIIARLDDGALRITVTDDGAGNDGNGSFPHEGIGLGNTRDRLAQLYGDDHSLTTGAADAGGFVVTVRIPAVAPAVA